jgi:hypothetical protein
VVNRVRNQVSNELREAVRIPFAGATPRRVEAKIVPGMARLDLADRLATDLRQVGRLALDRHATAPATSGEIEELVDHAPPGCNPFDG